MTALAESYARLSTAPDADLRIAELDEADFATVTGHGDAWILGSDLAADGPEAYARLRRAAVAYTGEVDAKTIGLAMGWAAGPVVAGPLAVYATERRVPLATLGDLAIRPHGEEGEMLLVRPVPYACLPDDAAIGSDPFARPVAGIEALRGSFVARVELLVDPIVEHLHRRTTIARAAIWGMVAGAVAYGLAEARVKVDPMDGAIGEARTTVAGSARFGRRLPELFVFDSAVGPWFGLKASVCCRASHWDGRGGEVCLSCPLRDDASRLAGLRAWREGLPG